MKIKKIIKTLELINFFVFLIFLYVDYLADNVKTPNEYSFFLSDFKVNLRPLSNVLFSFFCLIGGLIIILLNNDSPKPLKFLAYASGVLVWYLTWDSLKDNYTKVLP